MLAAIHVLWEPGLSFSLSKHLASSTVFTFVSWGMPAVRLLPITSLAELQQRSEIEIFLFPWIPASIAPSTVPPANLPKNKPCNVTVYPCTTLLYLDPFGEDTFVSPG